MHFIDKFNITRYEYQKDFYGILVGCAVDKCLRCDRNDINICRLCPQQYYFKNQQCQKIYDEVTTDILMFSIMCFIYFALFLYVIVAIFKPYLWILVVLIFESTQIIALLTITDSFHYSIYFAYSAAIGFNPGFINFLRNMNIFDKSSYHYGCISSFLSVFNDRSNKLVYDSIFGKIYYFFYRSYKDYENHKHFSN